MDLIYMLDAADSTLCEGILVPNALFNVVSTIIKGIKIVVPILLIIWGMMDFTKSVVAKKEEDIKKISKSFCFTSYFCFDCIFNCICSTTCR